jgi:hypothetical protein
MRSGRWKMLRLSSTSCLRLSIMVGIPPVVGELPVPIVVLALPHRVEERP